MNISTTTSSDNKRVIFSMWKEDVSATLTFTPEEARKAIAEIEKQVAILDRIAHLEEVRASAEKMLSELTQ